MNGRDNRIYEEAAALWRSVSDGAPPAGLSGPELLMHVLQLMEPGPYEHLVGARRHGRQITWPIH